MKGRGNKDLIIRLFRDTENKKTFHLNVARRLTDGRSRIDSIGKLVIISDTSVYLKIDVRKIQNYLAQNVSFSKNFAKIIGMEPIFNYLPAKNEK